MSARQVLVVRHGQSSWNVDHRFTGQADPPLSALGQSQAADLAVRCEGLDVSAVVTSDLARAYETGLAVTKRLRLPDPVTVADLRERWSETLTGLTRDEIESSWPGQLEAWREARPIAVPGRHETFDAFAERVVRGLVAAAGHGDRVLVAAHAGVFVVLGRIDGSGSVTETANAEGRWITVEAGEISEVRPAQDL